MQGEKIVELVVEALEDIKAVDVQIIDVKDQSNVTDYMVIASGTSRRHVKAVAENVLVTLKEKGLQPKGTEGADAADWVLVDMGDVLVHVMMPDTRDFYDLEKLWQMLPDDHSESAE